MALKSLLEIKRKANIKQLFLVSKKPGLKAGLIKTKQTKLIYWLEPFIH
jgi:hypothetical protein